MFSSVFHSLLLLDALISFQEPAEGAPDGSRGKTLSAAELDEMQQAFNMFDKNGNGLIDGEELKALLKALSLMVNSTVSDQEIKTMVQSVDTDGDGTINFQEFGAMLCGNTPSNQRTARKLFESLDIDGDGFVSLEEVISSLLFDSEEKKLALKEAEVKNNGKLDCDGFKVLLKKMGNSDQSEEKYDLSFM